MSEVIYGHMEPFKKLRDQLIDDLGKTGFSPQTSPPCSEPRLQDKVSRMTEHDLKDLYDEFLAYYDYLTDQITKWEVYLGTTKEMADTVHGAVLLNVHKDKALKNAELRKAAVAVHPAYLAARKDYLYVKQMHSAQDERRRRISKSMDRIYRELMLRTQDDSNRSFETQRHPGVKKMFRPVGSSIRNA